jgi:hypothetical protein
MKLACLAAGLSWALAVAQGGLLIAGAPEAHDGYLLAAWAGAPFVIYCVTALLVHRSATASGVVLGAVVFAGLVSLAACFAFGLHAPRPQGDEVAGYEGLLPVNAVVLLGLPLLHWVFACGVGLAALAVSRSEDGLASGAVRRAS